MMRRWLAGFAFVLVTPFAARAEVRGVWVVRTGLVSAESVDRVVDQAVTGGFNTLLVQVRGRGDAFYLSDVAPRSVLLSGRSPDFDPLARLLARARARRLAVHAWVNVLLTAHFGQPLPEGHVLLAHPDWVMVPREAAREALDMKGRERLRLVAAVSPREDVEGYYISPTAPGVPEHLEAVIREILERYRVDGLHLDFMRYPSADFDYSRSALESFRRARGGGDLFSAPSRFPDAWDEHRRLVLTSLAERLSRTARNTRPGVVVSAAVVASEADAIHRKFQAWPSWLAQKTIDAVCPMAYTPDPQLFRVQIEHARAKATAGQGVWAGVGAYRLTMDGVMQNIRSARDAGASGVLLFSHESLGAVDLERLRKEAFDPAVLASR